MGLIDNVRHTLKNPASEAAASPFRMLADFKDYFSVQTFHGPGYSFLFAMFVIEQNLDSLFATCFLLVIVFSLNWLKHKLVRALLRQTNLDVSKIIKTILPGNIYF